MPQDETLARGPLVPARAPMLAIRERQQAAIARLGLRALAGTAVDELLDAVLDTLASELELEHAGVLELLPGGDLRVRAHVGWRDMVNGRTIVPAEADSQVGLVLASGEPVVVGDMSTEHRFSSTSVFAEPGVASGVTVAVEGWGPWACSGRTRPVAASSTTPRSRTLTRGRHARLRRRRQLSQPGRSARNDQPLAARAAGDGGRRPPRDRAPRAGCRR